MNALGRNNVDLDGRYKLLAAAIKQQSNIQVDYTQLKKTESFEVYTKLFGSNEYAGYVHDFSKLLTEELFAIRLLKFLQVHLDFYIGQKENYATWDTREIMNYSHTWGKNGSNADIARAIDAFVLREISARNMSGAILGDLAQVLREENEAKRYNRLASLILGLTYSLGEFDDENKLLNGIRNKTFEESEKKKYFVDLTYTLKLPLHIRTEKFLAAHRSQRYAIEPFLPQGAQN